MTALRTPAACLIGWPAAHSRSPLIHRYWLRTLGIEGGYVIEAVPPDEITRISCCGCRCAASSAPTSPSRTRRMRWRCPSRMRAPARSARPIRCGLRTASCCSTNTDVEGFINNLDASAPGWDKAEDALVLGAGGASRAVVFGLLERGIKRVHLANRTIERAQRAGGPVRRERSSAGWDAIGDLLPRAGLLVNTTSLGMHGQPPLELDVGAAAVTTPSWPISSMCRWKRRCWPLRGRAA